MPQKGAIFIALLLMPLAALFGQGSWERIPVPTDHFLRSVVFTDSLHGWAAGNDGAIIHTADGGESWSLQESGTTNDIADLFFLDSLQGWASSFNFMVPPYGTVLLKTVDGGEEWTQIPYPEENIFINCILWLDSLHGWMGGSPHALVHTSDGGESWQQAWIDTTTLAFFPVLCIKFWDENYGYASGGMFDIAGVIWRTWDGGDTWYAIDPSQAPADEVHELHLYDSLTVLGAGGDPDFGYGVGLMRTWDGGLNWDYSELGIQGNAYDLDFRNDTEVWAPLGPRRKMIYSTDGGEHWTQITPPDSTAIFDICFPDTLHGWAVGVDGAVLKYTPPDPVSLPEYSLNQEYYQLKCFPNPFTNTTTITFTIPSSPSPPISRSSNLPIPLSPNPQVLITLHSLLGNKTATLVEEKLMPGEHSITFDGSGLPAGIYLCRLLIETDEGISSGSVKLIKKD
jgi:photosystem II stability/assembly factor-like uncharacterized protein